MKKATVKEDGEDEDDTETLVSEQISWVSIDLSPILMASEQSKKESDNDTEEDMTKKENINTAHLPPKFKHGGREWRRQSSSFFYDNNDSEMIITFKINIRMLKRRGGPRNV